MDGDGWERLTPPPNILVGTVTINYKVPENLIIVFSITRNDHV